MKSIILAVLLLFSSVSFACEDHSTTGVELVQTLDIESNEINYQNLDNLVEPMELPSSDRDKFSAICQNAIIDDRVSQRKRYTKLNYAVLKHTTALRGPGQVRIWQHS